MKLKNKLILRGISLLGATLLCTSSTYAWFSATNRQADAGNISGGLVANYFHCGSGTQSDPYVITRPIHYYNLIGLYQRKSDEFGIAGCYYQLGYDLDNSGINKVYEYDDDGQPTGNYSTSLNMKYYSGSEALLPIGTSNVPFKGSFNGNNLTVSNLNVCAYHTVNGVDYGTSDVGIFGYVTDDASISNIYYDNVTLSLDGGTNNYACATNPSSHKSDGSNADTVYVGYLIGHLQSYTSSNGVINSVPFHDVYLDNVIVTGAPNASYTKCDYGYIGHIETLDGKKAQTVTEKVDGLGSAGSGDVGWGGSIDMISINRRFTYMVGASQGHNGKDISKFPNYIDAFNSSYNPVFQGSRIRLQRTSKNSIYSYFYVSDDEASITGQCYLLKGTYIPLNVDTDTMFGNSDIKTSSTGKLYKDGDISYTIYSTDWYNSNASTSNPAEIVKSSNTGYFVGCGDIRNGLSVSSTTYPYTIVTNSVAATELGLTSGTTCNDTGSNLSVQAVNMNNGTMSTLSNVSEATSFGYTQYEKVFTQFVDTIKGKEQISGLHFYQDSSITSTRVTGTNVSINGTSYPSYQFAPSSINFTLAEEGKITALLTNCYSSSSSKQCSFNLYKIDRNGSTINSVTKIDSIYTKVTNGVTDYRYNSSATGYTKVYDSTWYNNLNAYKETHLLYYQEIPVGAGDFAIGNPSNAYNSYLMYLDIGTNGNQALEPSSGTQVSTTPLFTQIDYKNNGTVTNSPINIGYSLPSGANSSNFSIKVNRDTTNSNLYIIDITNTTGSSMGLSVLLCDDDNIADNDYNYSYKIKYNGSYFDDGTNYDSTSGYTSSFNFSLN